MQTPEKNGDRPPPIILPPTRQGQEINLVSDESSPSDSAFPIRNTNAGINRSTISRASMPAIPTHRQTNSWSSSNSKDLGKFRITKERDVREEKEKSIARNLKEMEEIHPAPKPAREPTPEITRVIVPKMSDLIHGSTKAQASTAASLSCAYCTATGVNAQWRRDRTGRPLCGRCCDQLRRRMNPRLAAQTATTKGQNDTTDVRALASRELPSLRSSSPSGAVRNSRSGANLASHPYFRSLPAPNLQEDRPVQDTLQRNYRPSTIPSNTNGSDNRYRAEIPKGYVSERPALPPLSAIERIADNYPSSKPPLSPSRRFMRPRDEDETPTELAVRDRRAMLVEGRRWILDMLDDTTAMIRHLDNASFRASNHS